MSDNKEIIIKVELPQLVNDTLKPLASSIGTTLSHGWEGMTVGIETWYGRKMIDKDLNLKLYKENIEKELSNISEENLQEPKMNILGPAFDASTYYFEEEQYRIMFSKLIASSCDKSKNSVVHPAFVEFIKQMTPKEAILISSFKNDFEQPIANYRFILKDGSGEKDFQTYVFYQNDNEQSSPSENASAIINLERLGFVSIDFSRYFTHEKHYSKYQNDPFYCAMKHETVTANQANPNWPYSDLIIQKGIVKVTPLGKDFIKVCIE